MKINKKDSDAIRAMYPLSKNYSYIIGAVGDASGYESDEKLTLEMAKDLMKAYEIKETAYGFYGKNSEGAFSIELRMELTA